MRCLPLFVGAAILLGGCATRPAPDAAATRTGARRGATLSAAIPARAASTSRVAARPLPPGDVADVLPPPAVLRRSQAQPTARVVRATASPVPTARADARRPAPAARAAPPAALPCADGT